MTTVQDPPAGFDQDRYDSGRFSGVIELTDASGDTKLMWDSRNVAEVDMAKTVFKKAIKDGSLIYSVKGKRGEKAEVVREFDPALERIIITPQPVGG